MDGLHSRAAAWGLVVALALGLASGCGGGDSDASGRVLVVGLDGASLRVIEPMIAAGRPSGLERLSDEVVPRTLLLFMTIV